MRVGQIRTWISNTGRPSQPSLESPNTSAPMVGSIREANWRIASLYNSATRTGFGRVFVMKLTRVCRCGRILESNGALVRQSELNMKRNDLDILRGCRIRKCLIETAEPDVVSKEEREHGGLYDIRSSKAETNDSQE